MPRKPTKPKARKVPMKGTPQDKTEVELLIARHKWLKADQAYQAANAQTDEESEKLIYVHEQELDKIAAKLAARAPTSHRDIFLLLELIALSLKDGFRTDGLDVDIMRNVLDAFYPVWTSELAAEREKAKAKATADIHAG
jgi:hypothetical protein